MRVLYFSQDYTPHDFRFLKTAQEGGHEVHYLRLEDRGAHLEQRALPEEVAPVEWAGGNRPFRWTDWPELWLDLRRVLGQLRPDLVHAGPVQGPAFMTALAGFRPLVTASWGSDLLLGARRGPGRWAAQYTLSKTDLFLCDAEVVQKAAAKLGMPSGRTVRFPWGVDLESFSPGDGNDLRAELGWGDALILLSTRAWEPVYGIDTLLSGFIQAARIDSRLKLLMLGGGSLRPKLFKQIETSGLSDRVAMIGNVPYENLPDYYRAADLYVSASRSDGSSISLLEALACGLPALVSDIPGNREWVIPGVNGWLFRRDDAEDLTARLLEAVLPAKIHGSLREAARGTAERKADWRDGAKAVLVAYQRAVKVRGKVSAAVTSRGG